MILRPLFHRKLSITNIINVFLNLFRAKKIVELLSFIYWEIQYNLSFYKKDEVLKFLEIDPLCEFKHIKQEMNIISSGYKITNNKYNWSYSAENFSSLWGCLFEDETKLYQLISKNKLVECYQFDNKITGLYIDKLNNIYTCVKGIIYKSKDNGYTFKKVLELSTEKSYFLKDAFTETPSGELFIGEYANIWKNNDWVFVGYLYHSKDNGDNWEILDFLKHQNVNKHIHIVKWSNLINGLILSEGDNKKRIWFTKSNTNLNTTSNISEDGWKKVNKYHIQKGGHTAIVELNGEIIFGSDYMGGTNFLISTKDMLQFNEKVVPNPHRRCLFRRMMVRINKNGESEIWTNLNFEYGGGVKCLIMVSVDLGKTWRKVIQYDGKQFKVRMISYSNHIAKELYILLVNNKYNTSTTLQVS